MVGIYGCAAGIMPSESLIREDITAECIHTRVLHTSLVRTLDHAAHAPPMTEMTLCLDSEPTVFENYVQDLYIDDQMIELSLWDTAGALFMLQVRTSRNSLL